jgi:hypothetical protein
MALPPRRTNWGPCPGCLPGALRPVCPPQPRCGLAATQGWAPTQPFSVTVSELRQQGSEITATTATLPGPRVTHFVTSSSVSVLRQGIYRAFRRPVRLQRSIGVDPVSAIRSPRVRPDPATAIPLVPTFTSTARRPHALTVRSRAHTVFIVRGGLRVRETIEL